MMLNLRYNIWYLSELVEYISDIRENKGDSLILRINFQVILVRDMELWLHTNGEHTIKTSQTRSNLSFTLYPQIIFDLSLHGPDQNYSELDLTRLSLSSLLLKHGLRWLRLSSDDKMQINIHTSPSKVVTLTRPEAYSWPPAN